MRPKYARNPNQGTHSRPASYDATPRVRRRDGGSASPRAGGALQCSLLAVRATAGRPATPVRLRRAPRPADHHARPRLPAHRLSFVEPGLTGASGHGPPPPGPALPGRPGTHRPAPFERAPELAGNPQVGVRPAELARVEELPIASERLAALVRADRVGVALDHGAVGAVNRGTQRVPGVQLLFHYEPARLLLLCGGLKGWLWRPPPSAGWLPRRCGERLTDRGRLQAQVGRHGLGLGEPLIEIRQDRAETRRVRR